MGHRRSARTDSSSVNLTGVAPRSHTLRSNSRPRGRVDVQRKSPLAIEMIGMRARHPPSPRACALPRTAGRPSPPPTAHNQRIPARHFLELGPAIPIKT
jgi:hypothetical protein